ncbi:MAG: DsbA family protein, partial [Myxococcales bacterium]|nr:DsbA family protein [Myxococcales bacterium]
YMLHDLTRWAARLGVPFQFSASFPHNSLMAMRALTAAGEDERVALSHAIFRAAWVENRNISDPKVLADVLGDRAEALLAATSDPAVKAELMKTTQEAIDAGSFGAPTFLVNGELHFGNDRLDFALEAALRS